jgi:hypothetical protein
VQLHVTYKGCDGVYVLKEEEIRIRIAQLIILVFYAIVIQSVSALGKESKADSATVSAARRDNEVGKWKIMGNKRGKVLGAYRLIPTKQLFDNAWETKYGGQHLPREEKGRAEQALREELSSIVLLEILINNIDANFYISAFGQEDSDQAPYMEVYLNEDGTEVISDLHQPETDTLRIAFYLHYFDAQKKLESCYGPIDVPPIKEIPDRLKNLVPYEPVD